MTASEAAILRWQLAHPNWRPSPARSQARLDIRLDLDRRIAAAKARQQATH